MIKTYLSLRNQRSRLFFTFTRMRKRSNIPLLLILMLVYILAQLGWWAFLITELTGEVYKNSPKMNLRIWMVLGEGMVFATLLLMGFIYTYKAYKKEIELSRKQKNFLLSVTHEFKTPIASLRLFLETIHKRELDNKQKEEFITRALNDVDRLNGITENILLAAKIDMQAFPVTKTKTDFSALVKKVIDNLAASIGKNYKTVSDIQSGIIKEIDEHSMVSVITNLYDNAVKYSPEGSEIKISLSENNNRVILKVADQGTGINENKKKMIFEKFYRIQDEDTRSAKGTGLGLYITKYFVEQHGGKINVSENIPKGTVMEIIFPA